MVAYSKAAGIYTVALWVWCYVVLVCLPPVQLQSNFESQVSCSHFSVMSTLYTSCNVCRQLLTVWCNKRVREWWMVRVPSMKIMSLRAWIRRRPSRQSRWNESVYWLIQVWADAHWKCLIWSAIFKQKQVGSWRMSTEVGLKERLSHTGGLSSRSASKNFVRQVRKAFISSM